LIFGGILLVVSTISNSNMFVNAQQRQPPKLVSNRWC